MSALYWKVAALLALGVLGLGSLSLLESPSSGRPAMTPEELAQMPNILLVVLDDARADDLRFMPNVRKFFADNGTQFTDAISSHPLCCPARASLLSGQYGQNNGVVHNSGPRGGYKAFDPSHTLATWLEATGYRSAFHGKHLNNYPVSPVDDPGWTRWDPLIAGTLSYLNFALKWDADGDGQSDDFSDSYVTRVLHRRAEQTIRDWAGGAPWFVHINEVAPHLRKEMGSDLKPPPGETSFDAGTLGRVLPKTKKKRPLHSATTSKSVAEKNVKDKEARVRKPSLSKEMRTFIDKSWKGRAASLNAVDREFKRTLDVLRETGQLAQTNIIFTSDNGFLMGEHNRLRKDVLFAEALEVPLLISGPGIPPGRKTKTAAALVDIPATIVDITRSVPSIEIDGKSLLGAANGTPNRNVSLVQTGSKKERRGDQPFWNYRGVRTSRYTYGYRPSNSSHYFLYDRKLDPDEVNNVRRNPAYAHIRKQLRAMTKSLESCRGQGECNTFVTLGQPKWGVCVKKKRRIKKGPHKGRFKITHKSSCTSAAQFFAEAIRPSWQFRRQVIR